MFGLSLHRAYCQFQSHRPVLICPRKKWDNSWNLIGPVSFLAVDRLWHLRYSWTKAKGSLSLYLLQRHLLRSCHHPILGWDDIRREFGISYPDNSLHTPPDLHLLLSEDLYSPSQPDARLTSQPLSPPASQQIRRLNLRKQWMVWILWGFLMHINL